MLEEVHLEPPGIRELAQMALPFWTGRSTPLLFVRYFNNAVYRFRHLGQTHYLRLTSGQRRTAPWLDAELQFILYLKAQGLSVCAPIPTPSQHLIQPLFFENSPWFAVVFEEAQGQEPNGSKVKPHFIEQAGALLGHLHRAAETYPRQDARFDWPAEHWPQIKHIPNSETTIWDTYHALKSWIDGLAERKDSFGWIHGDFTLANLSQSHSGKLMLFDFDDSCRHFYTYDIACFLHYFSTRSETERHRIWHAFAKGYQQYRPLTLEQKKQIPQFSRLRLLYSFLVYADIWGTAALSERQKQYLENRRQVLSKPSPWLFIEKV